MILRPQPNVVVATAVVLGVAVAACRTARSATAALTLRVESHTDHVVVFQVSATPPGIGSDSGTPDAALPKVVGRTPTVLRIADSVRTLHVLVEGPGAVRLRFAPGGASEGPGARPWGRDITLTRGPDDHFHPVWRVHELVP